MKKVIVLTFFAAMFGTISFAADNLTEHTNTPQDRLSPSISNDGSEITEYVTKDKKDISARKNQDKPTQEVVVVEEVVETPVQEVVYERVIPAEETDVKSSVPNVEFSTNTPQDRLSPSISNDGSEITEYIRK